MFILHAWVNNSVQAGGNTIIVALYIASLGDYDDKVFTLSPADRT